MAKITSEELSPELLNLINNAGNSAELENELSLLSKMSIAEHFGAPLNPTDSFKVLCEGIDTVLNNFKLNLASKGVLPNSNDKFQELVDKILNIDGEEILYLYNDGDECTDITGGWVDEFAINDATYIRKNIIKNTNNMQIINEEYKYLSCGTKNLIDITNYKYLYMEYEVISPCSIVSNEFREGVNFGVVKSKTETSFSGNRYACDNDSIGKHISFVDLSNLYNEYYVRLSSWAVNNSNYANFKISKIWLVKNHEVVNKDNIVTILNNEGIETDGSETANDLIYKISNNLIEAQKEELKNILISKGVEVADSENKMSILIQKVNELIAVDRVWLYKDGNEYTDITGGYTDSYALPNNWTRKNHTKNSDNLLLSTIGTSGNQACIVGTENFINLDGYSKLKMEVTVVNKAGSCWLGLQTRLNKTENASTTNTTFQHLTSGTHTIETDISSLSSNQGIVFYCNSDTGSYNSAEIKVHKIWLEK